MRLTKANIAALALPDGKTDMVVFDDDLPGFGLRMRAGGKRVWIAQYRVGPKQRRITLGNVEAIEPTEARKLAKATLAKVASGADPQAEKVEAREKPTPTLTLSSVVDSYLTGYAAPRMKPRSLVEVRRHLEKHWSPLAGAGLNDVSRAMVAARLGKIAEENGPIAANRARAALSALFSWAIGEGLADSNPVIGTHRPAEEVSRDRVLTDEELRLVWNCSGSGDFADILRLLILTAARREEVGAMLWTEFDGATWTIGADRSKNHIANALPMSRQAIDILTRRPRREGRELVFGFRDGPFQGWSDAKADLDARMTEALKSERGDKAKLTPWRLHDLRRTAATRMGDLGVQPHIVEAVLGHISGSKAGVAGVYNRASYLPEKRAALALWAEHVQKTVNPSGG